MDKHSVQVTDRVLPSDTTENGHVNGWSPASRNEGKSFIDVAQVYIVKWRSRSSPPDSGHGGAQIQLITGVGREITHK